MGALPFQALDIFQANHKDLDSKVQRDYVASFASCKTLHGPFVQKFLVVSATTPENSV